MSLPSFAGRRRYRDVRGEGVLAGVCPGHGTAGPATRAPMASNLIVARMNVPARSRGPIGAARRPWGRCGKEPDLQQKDEAAAARRLSALVPHTVACRLRNLCNLLPAWWRRRLLRSAHSCAVLAAWQPHSPNSCIPPRAARNGFRDSCIGRAKTTSVIDAITRQASLSDT